jgi:hypothetical protein
MCYILIGHESALPHVFIVAYMFFFVHRLKAPPIYCLLASCPINPIIPLFSLGTLWYLHHLPLYYKRPIYYCLGLVVKSPVLYFLPHLNQVLYSLIRAAVS